MCYFFFIITKLWFRMEDIDLADFCIRSLGFGSILSHNLSDLPTSLPTGLFDN
jgi:hypothetical protein